MTHPDLAGKAAIVTGAGAGIGLAVARAARRRGLQRAVRGHRRRCRRCRRGRRSALAQSVIEVDVSDEEQVIGMVEACVGAFGGVDKLVANAGVVHFAPLIDTTVEDFDRVIAINLRGAWLCTKHAAPRMVERGGGAIVNMSSLAGHVGGGRQCGIRHVQGRDQPPQPRHRRRAALVQHPCQRAAAAHSSTPRCSRPR